MGSEIGLVDDQESERVMPGPPLRGIFSPWQTLIT